MASETATKLLDEAQALIQRRGYNGFSYRDLATAIGIKTASIHYHFPTKADLGAALIERYLQGLEASLTRIEREEGSARARLEAFVALYRQTEAAGAICLCGSLASDHETLAPEVQGAVGAYLDRSEAWVREQLEAGDAAGELTCSEPASAAALLLSSLQGGLILARARGAHLLQDLERSFFASLS